MYTVIHACGRQHKVVNGKKLYLERMAHDKGARVEFPGVSFVESEDGSVKIKKSTVIAVVLDEIRSDKVIVFKKQRRHNHRRKKGHRQIKLPVLIEQVVVCDGAA
ncbi:50S ribosomal protein L21 [Candidatus Hydrogenosomobacter endosymbioticus]|uniref:Large ribosomal subunit protein bL21 n=1 Tax=Candidatus Hydrogenosomobacter endosymbioticus TaxID=2558174 RepID=A0ABN6L2G8_9PROT|nr:50S ribosomal protein L21 [Candidatus Hydrogenosomobacter endosymbioticus]BDB95958.1 50S ribosomal protein L21 [Candidatus Hydrogenosomobacter endosymbioticus]